MKGICDFILIARTSTCQSVFLMLSIWKDQNHHQTMKHKTMKTVKIQDDRLNYLKRLVASVKATALENRVMIHGEECIEHDWVDIELLCDVVTKEVLEPDYKP